MEEKKVLTIDTMICDLRTVSEETLQSYEKIYISAMTVFITERTQELFHRYPVDLDAMAVEKLDENVRLVEQNGVYKITDQQYKYVVDTYDAMELMPWIRTFMGRIEKLESSNPQLKKKFDQDMEQLYSMYFGEVQNDIS